MSSTTSILRRRHARRAEAKQGARKVQRSLAGLGLTLAATIVLGIVAASAALASFYVYFTRDLPSAEALQAAFDPSSSDFFQTTQIFDRTGQHIIYEVIDPRGGDRQYVSYSQIPTSVINATISIEDKTFFTNPGYDLVGITRALVSNVGGG
jgi:membrane peptidoglycan carboxypeptidase